MSTAAKIGRLWSQKRHYLLPLPLVAMAWVILGTIHPHYPVHQWLVWRYLAAIVGAAVFALACVCSGFRLASWLGSGRHLSERLVLSFCYGVLAFFMGLFVAAACGQLYSWVFWVLPLGLVASGIVPLWRYVSLRWVRARLSNTPSAGVRGLSIAVLLYGAVALLLVYIPILNPENIAYDSRWYHLALAEHYVAAGGLTRFDEGWLPATIPHLSSFLYAWAFLGPGDLFQKVVLAAQLEFVCFLFTLFGINVIVRRLSPPGTSLAWAGLFLFPGIFVYDSMLSAAADHISALWAVPVYLAMLRLVRRWDLLSGIELGLFAAAAVLTKYTALTLLALPAIVVLYQAGFRGLRGPRSWSIVTVPALTGLVALVFTTPHWLKNLIWHGDPLYPMLRQYFDARPWTPSSPVLWEKFQAGMWTPKGELAEKLQNWLEVLANFAFVPHDWAAFHGKMPVFGFLFSALTLTLPLLSRAKRLWLLAGGCYLGITVWFFTNAQDRYLQTLLPWFAAFTVAAILRIWRTHRLNRAFLCALVGVQVLLSLRAPVIGSHAMQGRSAPISAALNYFTRTLGTNVGAPFAPLSTIGRRLPPNAKVLVHDMHPHLGIAAPSVNDAVPAQLGLSYASLGSVTAVHERLSELAVTHIITPAASVGWQSLASDLLFWSLLHDLRGSKQKIGGLQLYTLSDSAPPARGDRVLYLGCDKRYRSGLYKLEQLTLSARSMGEVSPAYGVLGEDVPFDVAQELADFVVEERACTRRKRPSSRMFQRIGRRPNKVVLYQRKL